MQDEKWVVYHVKYVMPLFGADPVKYSDTPILMMVSTQGGKKDAEAACKKYHPGCKIVETLTLLESLAGVSLAKKPKEATKKTKKGSKK